MSNNQYRSLVQQAISRPQRVVRHTRSPNIPATKAPRLPEVAPPEVESLQSEQFAPNELYIHKALPPKIAILHVYADGSEQYRLWGHSSSGGLLEDGPHLMPNLMLGEMVHSRKHPKLEIPQVIIELMGEFSHSHLKLRKWLNRQHQAGNPYLVIADHTDFEIPWEMFRLSRHHYLGTTFATARWQHVIGDDNLWLQLKAEACCGQVVAHVNHEELKGIEPELALFEQVHSQTHSDILTFRATLEQHLYGIGLVYIATHGFFSRGDIRQMALGSLHNKKQRLRLMDLRWRKLSMIQKSGSIIFLNTCHSGRLLMEKKYISDTYQRGFAELFLSKGAKGVIATLGGVNDAHAAKTAHHLIKKVLKQPNTPLSELLRQLRAEVVATLPDEPEEKDLLPVIYTFMYVYYGNPMTTLELTKRKG